MKLAFVVFTQIRVHNNPLITNNHSGKYSYYRFGPYRSGGAVEVDAQIDMEVGVYLSIRWILDAYERPFDRLIRVISLELMDRLKI